MIGSSVTSIAANAFKGCSATKVIYCKATTVPPAQNTSFEGIPSDCIIYVPRSIANYYESMPFWSDFKIRGYDF